MRLRIAALCGLLCLLVSEVQAQGNQISFSHIIARPGEERTIPLDGTFIDGLSGLVVTVLFNPSVIQPFPCRPSRAHRTTEGPNQGAFNIVIPSTHGYIWDYKMVLPRGVEPRSPG